jgi:DNA-directed RNA polymerase subunit RPC12/RpoP
LLDDYDKGARTPQEDCVIEFLGRSPSDITEYRCRECGAEFDFRATDWKTRPDYLEPLYCPMCGEPANL